MNSSTGNHGLGILRVTGMCWVPLWWHTSDGQVCGVGSVSFQIWTFSKSSSSFDSYYHTCVYDGAGKHLPLIISHKYCKARDNTHASYCWYFKSSQMLDLFYKRMRLVFQGNKPDSTSRWELAFQSTPPPFLLSQRLLLMMPFLLKTCLECFFEKLPLELV